MDELCQGLTWFKSSTLCLCDTAMLLHATAVSTIAGQYLTAWIDHNLPIFLLMDMWVRLLSVFGYCVWCATKVLARVFGAFTLPMGIFLQEELLGFRVCSTFDDTDMLFSKVVSPIYIPTECTKTPTAPRLCRHLVFSVFHFSHSD